LRVLQPQQSRSWHYIVTFDESWFYLRTDHEFIWLQADEEVPERERHTIQSEKVMLTIVWNPTGFHLIDFLSRRAKFNGTHSVSNIPSLLAIWRETQMGKADRKLIVHSDNARPHTAKKVLDFLEQNGMERAPHPPYSPDLAPCDFYLFGYVRGLLAGSEFADRTELEQAVVALLDGIEKATLSEVFLTWTARVKTCIQTNGEYVE
jgi:histone-lysine N-methyltransferase SETMAR